MAANGARLTPSGSGRRCLGLRVLACRRRGGALVLPGMGTLPVSFEGASPAVACRACCTVRARIFCILRATEPCHPHCESLYSSSALALPLFVCPMLFLATRPP